MKKTIFLLFVLFCGVFLFSNFSQAANWTTTTVDASGNFSMYSSIALDSSGNPHISYYDTIRFDLKYAVKSGGSWTKTTVDAGGSVGRHNSITLDSSGNPHISYYDTTNASLKYAVKSRGNWAISTVDTGGNVGMSTSIALDSSGNPHISYYDVTNTNLKYAVKSGGSWTTITVDNDGGVGSDTSIALDSSNNPHISYHDNTNTSLKYAVKSGGSWTTTTIDANGSVGWDNSIALSSSNNPHISYYDFSNTNLKYAVKSGGSWTTATIDANGSVGWNNSIALNSSNNPRISYWDTTNTNLKYAARSNGSWTKTTIDNDGSVGAYTSIALDSDNNSHISYHDATNTGLKYATTVYQGPSDGDPTSDGGVYDERTDSNGNTTLVDINPKILTTSGPGEPTRLQAYARNQTDGKDSLLSSDMTGLFPSSYLGGAGIVPIDQNDNGVKDQFLLFAINNGGPQALAKGLKEDGSISSLGQQFVFDSSIRDGLSVTVLDAEGDGIQNDAAFCLTGDRAPTVRVYTNIEGIDNWTLQNEFTAPFGSVGCNLGTFQYDTGAEEILVTPNHGPANPNVYIYTVDGSLKKQFSAYPSGVQSGLTPTGIGERIYTTPNNGSSQINVFDKNGSRKNFWWAYQEHIRGDFKNVAGDIDLDGLDELLVSPIGSNGPQVLAYEPSGKWRTWPNFFAFGDSTLRNGVGIAVIENWHGVN